MRIGIWPVYAKEDAKMQGEKRRWPLVLGIALCVLSLAVSVAL